MNPVSQAIAAAHAIAARAADGAPLPQAVLHDIADNIAEPLPALDGALAELTGEELKLLAFAADILSRRAIALESQRHTAARATAIAEIKKNRKV